jgi:hypothetical protein
MTQSKYLFKLKYGTFSDNPDINELFVELGVSDSDYTRAEVEKYLSVVDEPVSNFYSFLIYLPIFSL